MSNDKYKGKSLPILIITASNEFQMAYLFCASLIFHNIL